MRHKVALPLHPEYRTLPMVWYIPPLSPVADIVHAAGYDAGDPDRVFATIDSLRIPVEYLANLFTAGDAGTIRTVLRKLAAVRAIMRAGQLGLDLDEDLPASVGASADDLEDLYRLLAIAKYDDRYVIPPAHAEDAGRLAWPARAAVLQPGRRRRPGHGRHRPARDPELPATGYAWCGPVWPARWGPAWRWPDLPGRRWPHPLQPAWLGRPGQRAGPVPGAGPAG